MQYPLNLYDHTVPGQAMVWRLLGEADPYPATGNYPLQTGKSHWMPWMLSLIGSLRQVVTVASPSETTSCHEGPEWLKHEFIKMDILQALVWVKLNKLEQQHDSVNRWSVLCRWLPAVLGVRARACSQLEKKRRALSRQWHYGYLPFAARLRSVRESLGGVLPDE